MFKEFRTFITRGNVVDLAVGIIIGASFGKIVDSFVKDLVMPPLGWILNRVDFRQLSVALPPGKDGKPVAIAYGNFISTLLDFLIVAFVIFLLVRFVNKVRELASRGKEPAPPGEKPCPFCCLNVPVKATKCGHCTSEIPAA